MLNEKEKIIEDLKHFNELEFFVKKYNDFVYNFEKLQDILSKNELKRMHECATYLRYAVFRTEDNRIEKKLIHANFCRSRWCDICNWRRRIKYFNINLNKVKIIKEAYNAKFIFLTLTTKNVYYKNLKKGLNEILNAFKRFLQMNRIKNNSSILGFLRSLEFTIQKTDNRYINLHIHCLIAVKPSYFDTKLNNYLNQAELTELWQKALRVDYTPVIDVRLVKNYRKNKTKKVNRKINEEGAVFEVTKYLYKSIQFSFVKKEILEEIVKSFKNVRLIAPTGVFRSKKTAEEDEDSKKEDLIKIGDEKVEGELIGEAVYLLKDGFYRLQKFEEKE